MDFREFINRFLGFPNRRPPDYHDDSRYPSSGQHEGIFHDDDDER